MGGATLHLQFFCLSLRLFGLQAMRVRAQRCPIVTPTPWKSTCTQFVNCADGMLHSVAVDTDCQNTYRMDFCMTANRSVLAQGDLCAYAWCLIGPCILHRLTEKK